jgi:hypothetical protein
MQARLNSCISLSQFRWKFARIYAGIVELGYYFRLMHVKYESKGDLFVMTMFMKTVSDIVTLGLYSANTISRSVCPTLQQQPL